MFGELYDKVMSLSDYDQWYEKIKELLGEDLKECKRVLDLGCGTGEITKRLLNDGYGVTAVDLFDEMLNIAKTKCKSDKVEFVNGDIRRVLLDKKGDVAISMFDTVNYFLSLPELEDFFERANRNLEDGGVLLFDAVSENFMEEAFAEGAIIDDRGDLIRIWEYEAEDEIDVIYATYMVQDDSGKFVRIDEEYEKMVFTKDEILEMAIKNGFKLLKIEEDSELAGSRRFYLFRKERV